MKIDREYLKKLIQEELAAKSDQSRMTSTEFRKGQVASAMAQQTGLTDVERASLTTVIEKLKALAAKKDLASSGPVTALLRRLNDELDKALAK